MPAHSHLGEHNRQLAHATVHAAEQHALIGSDVRGALPDRAGMQRRTVRAVKPAGRAYYWRTACNQELQPWPDISVKTTK